MSVSQINQPEACPKNGSLIFFLHQTLLEQLLAQQRVWNPSSTFEGVWAPGTFFPNDIQVEIFTDGHKNLRGPDYHTHTAYLY